MGLEAIVSPDSVFEVRLLSGRRKRIDSGYFDNVAAAATALSSLSEPYKGIYITPNPVNPDLLARAKNRIKPWAEITTDDADVLRRLWLLIDIDPERPKDISSTNLEHQRALNLARSISGMLDIEYGWTAPMINSSGNGAHVLYPMNEPNDEDTRDAVRAFLQSLAYRFNGSGCKIDTSVFNAARIWRLPGTVARKGDSTTERPHRKARIIQPGELYSPITIEQVQSFTTDNPVPIKSRTSNPSAAAPIKDDKIFRKLNDTAMGRLDDWVFKYFPGSRVYRDGYRVTSEELGRAEEEDLSIQPYPVGILDFGMHDGDNELFGGKRSPVDIIAEFHHDGDIRAAATALADTLQVPLTEFGSLEHAQVDKSYREIFDEDEFDLSRIKTFEHLRRKNFKELKWLIPDVLPVGCFMLAARPKMRKTWLALQLSLAVATGGKMFDWQVNQGTALYLGLEDNERRLKKRIEILHTFEFDPPDLSRFHYFTEGTFPRGDDGVDVLKRWHDKNPDCSLMVIDTFAHWRKISGERDVYLKDYLAVMPLTRFADERQICTIIVHHEKKGLAGEASGDFLEDVNGSSGLTGGIDGVISIKGRRGVQEENESRKLLLTGRDVPHDYEIDMSFDAERGGWLPAARQDTKVGIRAMLTQNPFMGQNEIIAMLPNITPSSIRRALVEMKFAGEIVQNKHGYSLRR